MVHESPKIIEENACPCTWNKRMREHMSDEEEGEQEPGASRPKIVLRPSNWNNANEVSDESENEDEAVPKSRSRIVLQIPKSRLMKPSSISKPPKKTARLPTVVNCLECGEQETAVDRITKNGFEKCGD